MSEPLPVGLGFRAVTLVLALAALALLLMACSSSSGGGGDAGNADASPDGGLEGSHDGSGSGDAETDAGGDATVKGDGSGDAGGGDGTIPGDGSSGGEGSTEGGTTDGPPAEAAAVDAGVCGAKAWQTMSPMPTGANLSGIYEAAPGAVWAVGDAGTILHYDGTSWTLPPSGTSANLTAIWGASATDIWVVGQQGTALHWDGAAWSTVASGTTLNLTAVWGTASGDVWIAGSSTSGTTRGVVLHWDGATLSTAYSSTTDPFATLWASSSSDVWAGGLSFAGGSTFVHWDGSAWTPVTVSGATFVTTIWGSAPDDVWALGDGPQPNIAYHWDGTAWSALQLDGGGYPQVGGNVLYGFASNDIWTNHGAHWNGSQWSTDTTCTTVVNGGAAAIGGLSDGDMWIAGGTGLVSRFAAGVGTCSPQTPTFELPNGVASLWASSFDDAYVGSEHWGGTQWSPITFPTNPNYGPFGTEQVWGTSSTDVWMVGDLPNVPSGFNAGATHWDGQAWSEPEPIGYGYAGTSAIGGSGPSDVYVVLHGRTILGMPDQFVHYDGSSWTNVTTGPVTGGQSIWGSSKTDVYVTGSPMWHWDGTSWSNPAGAPGTGQIWGSSSTDVWVTGNPPYHYDGVAWAQDTSLPFSNVSSISGTGGGDVWMVADTGAWHWAGTSWFDTGGPGGSIVSTGGCTAWISQSSQNVARYGP